MLAVASLIMGADKAIGTDIEPLAIIAATRNAALNKVSSSFHAYTVQGDRGDGITTNTSNVTDDNDNEEEQYDVVVANILQGPLQQLAPTLAGKTKPGGGVIGLSGILVSQAAEVIEVYREHGFDGFEMTVDDVAGQWALVTAVKI